LLGELCSRLTTLTLAIDREELLIVCVQTEKSLGTSLGMAITAEGVETAEQLARIRGERCTHVQGYLTGRPMDTDQIPVFLAGNDLDKRI
jgi:EAL domain-containing protein (putative c-di-GMP-specific phosphodiesterase class I)